MQIQLFHKVTADIVQLLLIVPLHSYIVSNQAPLQVDFVSYMDDIAGEIGVRPSLLRLSLTDYSLFKRVLWGPVTAYQYRLMGPGKWDGARRAVFTQFDRMYQALKTRQVLPCPYNLGPKILNLHCKGKAKTKLTSLPPRIVCR